VTLSATGSILWTAAAAALVMALAWLRQRRTRDASLVDLLWTLGVGGAALLQALSGDGWRPRRVLVGVLVGAWAVRLAWHLARRLRAGGEDGRYAELRARLGSRADGWFFAFFQLQGLLVTGLALVFLVLCRAPEAGWRVQDGLAVALWLVALAGESAADRALARWRADPSRRGKTCRAGLWRYSRHPNYFFEWLHWCAYALLGLGLAHGAWLWLAPLAMYALVAHVTGIPPAEAQALRSRGDDYRRYQASTNAFFPGPPRAAHGA